MHCSFCCSMAVNLAAMGAAPAPTAAFLDTLAQTLRDKPIGRGWDCPLCQYRNNPVDNLLFKLPPFKCSNPAIDCQAKVIYYFLTICI